MILAIMMGMNSSKIASKSLKTGPIRNCFQYGFRYCFI